MEVKMKAFLRWLLRSRDGNSVTYSRFGLPGDELEERQAPTEIVVEPFNDNDVQFQLLTLCHSQKAALVSAGVGMSAVLLIFISSFFKFDWYNNQRGIDVLAIVGLLFYLIIGVAIHYGVIRGVQKQQPNLLVPFLICYMGMMTLELVGVISALGDLIADHGAEYASHHHMAVQILLIFVPSLAIQALMLLAVFKCKLYIARKTQHLLTMKVAQKSVTENPQMRIVNPCEQSRPPTETSVNPSI